MIFSFLRPPCSPHSPVMMKGGSVCWLRKGKKATNLHRTMHTPPLLAVLKFLHEVAAEMER